MTKITFETAKNKADYRICVAKPGLYKDLSNNIVIVTSQNIVTSGANGEDKVYGIASDDSAVTNGNFHVYPLVEVKAYMLPT
jgi:hypothetical protein